MKPLLSENGTIEIGFGIFACVVGALHLMFSAGDEPGAFQSDALLAAGLGIACYGVVLRWATSKRIRDQPEERRKQQSDKPSE